MSKIRPVWLGLGLVAMALAAPAVASAQEEEQPGFFERHGGAISVAGGTFFYSDGVLWDEVDAGVEWNLRFTLGTRTRFGAELAYVGATAAVQAEGLGQGATLLGGGAEALVRFNLCDGQYRPFVVAGVRWRHYACDNEGRNNWRLRQDADAVGRPFGMGMGMNSSRFVGGLRVVARPAFGGDISSEGESNVHNF